MTEGFLLVGTSAGETQILDQGKPVEVRQKFKSLIANMDDHDFVWIRYFSDYGDVKKRVFKKRLLKSFDELELPTPEADDYDTDIGDKFTGDELPIEPVKQRNRRSAHATRN